ncbi:DmsE family decaheme c-type cytochrome [Wenzhouxiangella marina]|uniref:Decaheme cytochrome c MtrA n=1 Tax=Wenzhouxiangella marina TaxID=1579979 RepID=A0A0K0XTX0_9GAMM|nr:DmsE family decaheme c-type cytochrome [Wenzhouxiangella marina]AKS41159.1 Decaheme cytochrome c MtrA [Wenzhouxiangella marina]MBB6088038.1 DmsE family decaheme c-type cytochrome [Wenzhouxiangella marina]
MRARRVGHRIATACQLAVVGLLLFALPDLAGQDQDSATATAAPGGAQSAETANCLICHGRPDDPLLDVQHGAHASLSGSGSDACIACHGASLEHARLPASIGGAHPDIVFSGSAAAPADEQNRVCSSCHAESALFHWSGSPHHRSELSCASCHQAHTIRDAALDPRLQVEQCLSCHTEQRAEIHRPFVHPVREGQLLCSDCHNPHGGTGPADLHRFTANETCYDCHAEKRGPFLWEHQPVQEDCGLCHEPHGALHRGLLTQRTPFLCQNCHMAQFHPSTALSGSGLPGETRPSGSQSLLGRDCMNCHVQVHGSNHPSGVGQTR